MYNINISIDPRLYAEYTWGFLVAKNMDFSEKYKPPE
jgi:hypothetical protein